MGKIGSTILTFLLSIPLTAVGFMAIFGVPQFTPLVASSDEEIVIRDPYEAQPWGHASEAQLGDASALGQPSSSSSAPSWNEQASWNEQQPPSHPQQFGGKSNPSHQGASQVPYGQRSYPQQPAQPGLHENAPPQNPFGNHLVSTENVQPSHGFESGHAFGQPGSSAIAPRSMPATFNPNPVPIANNPAGIPSSNHPNTTETSAQLLDWHQASLRLEELGIDRFHLERGVGDSSFLFVCLYNPADTPQVTHRFEAEGSDPLVAVNQVLSQIDGWLQKRFAAERTTATSSDVAFGITR